MGKLEVRKKEKLKFIEVLKEFNLSPLDMICINNGNNLDFHYKQSELFFQIVPSTNSYEIFSYLYTTYTPVRTPVDHLKRQFHLTDVLANFRKWIKENVLPYIEEQNSPDPWLVYLNKYSNETTLSKFDENEISKIENVLDNFTGFLINQKEIPNDKLEILEKEIKELKDNLKTQSKTKWIKSLILFVMVEVWDAVKDEAIMNKVKQYFFESLHTLSQFFLPT